MKYRKLNKYEAKEEKGRQLANNLAGSGLYLYRNNTQSEMTLPRPTKSGKREVAAMATFQGDSYYMQMVRTGLLRLVEVLQTPEQQAAVEQAEQLKLNEGNMNEQKLILDQPDIVKNEGTVEHVVNANTPQQKLNEKCGAQQEDVLLNECPCDDGFVIIDDK